MTAIAPRAIWDDIARPGTGVVAPVLSDTVDLVDENGAEVLIRDIWVKAAGTVAFVCLDGSSGSWTFEAYTGFPKGLIIKRLKSTGTDIDAANIVGIK